MDDLSRLVLRLVGVFYLLSAVFALRSVAMDRLLSAALAALTMGKDKATTADRVRNRFLTISALLIGAASLALLALLDLAAPLLLATVALQVLYVAYLAPRYIDVEEPPEPRERRKSILAAAMIAAAALFAVAAWWRGLLLPVMDAPLSAAAAGAGFLALAGYALSLSRRSDLRRGSRDEEPPADAADWPDLDDQAAFAPPEVDQEELARMAVVLTPGWGDLGIRDAESGEPLSYDVYQALLTQEERELLADWNCLFIDVADPNDPRRVGMTDPDGLRRLEELGRPIAERIAARLGPERVAFEPAPRPQMPTITLKAVKVMADYRCDPLWFHEEERVGCFSPSEFGLSWSLDLALGSWAATHDDGLDFDDPGGPARRSEAEAATEVAEGRVLAERLVRELAATGRGDVRVVYHPSGGSLERIGAGPPS